MKICDKWKPARQISDKITPAGGIAQMVERLHGMQEVSGSIPLISTTSPHRLEAQDTALSRRQQGFESPWGRLFYFPATFIIANHKEG